MKQLGVRGLKNKLWKIFSRYIRLRDKGKCFTCDEQDEIKYMDAGHYITRSEETLRFDERNVNCQCRKCNRFLEGNKSAYTLALQKKYGKGIIKELDEIRKETKHWKTSELEELISIYKEKLNEL